MLEEKINNDLKEAMKSKDAIRVSCLRMIIAGVKNASIAKQKELKDEDIIEVLQKQLKQHKDSIEGFKKGNRQDLVDKESRELEIIQSYLPEQLKPEEITNIVKEAVKETAAEGKKDMGKVMAAVMPKARGRADGKLVQKEVLEQLTKGQNKEQ